MMRSSYQTRLLELICDKLEIDYSELRAEAVDRERTARTKYLEPEKAKPLTPDERAALELKFLAATKKEEELQDEWWGMKQRGENPLMVETAKRNWSKAIREVQDLTNRLATPVKG